MASIVDGDRILSVIPRLGYGFNCISLSVRYTFLLWLVLFFFLLLTFGVWFVHTITTFSTFRQTNQSLIATTNQACCQILYKTTYAYEGSKSCYKIEGIIQLFPFFSLNSDRPSQEPHYPRVLHVMMTTSWRKRQLQVHPSC